jgi:hypothetical protein
VEMEFAFVGVADDDVDCVGVVVVGGSGID